VVEKLKGAAALLRREEEVGLLVGVVERMVRREVVTGEVLPYGRSKSFCLGDKCSQYGGIIYKQTSDEY